MLIKPVEIIPILGIILRLATAKVPTIGIISSLKVPFDKLIPTKEIIKITITNSYKYLG